MDIRTTFGKTQFDVRACGILHHNGNILISHETDGSATLTGGALKIGETSEQAVIREFLEETNLHVKVNKLVAVIENFFEVNSKIFQQIIFVYHVELQEDCPQILRCKEKLNVMWVATETVNNLKPPVLNELIQLDDDSLKHYLNRTS